MKNFLVALEKSLENKNWYASLAMSLALPDICGKIDAPQEASSSRFIKWYNQWVIDKYTHNVGAERKKHIFLTGEDFYALRCSFFHEGNSIITMQKKRKILDDFKFVTPPLSGGIWHCNFIDNPSGKFLLLQIDIFCRDIFNSVNDWINSKTPPEQEKINDDFLVIHDSSHGIQF